jgi:hypothetical protein
MALWHGISIYIKEKGKEKTKMKTAYIIYATKEYQHTLSGTPEVITVKPCQTVDISYDLRYIWQACQMYQKRGYPVVMGSKQV